MKATVERITDSYELAEGPHWDEKAQCLYFVDIFGKTIHKYVPANKKLTTAYIGKNVSFIIPIEGHDDQFLLGVEREIVSATWDGVSETVSKMEAIVEVDTEPQIRGNRFNDAKADPLGRLWAGTMGAQPQHGHYEVQKGTLYSLNRNKTVKSHLNKVHISNGLAWSADLSKFYYIDSGSGCIEQFDYDKDAEAITNRQTLFTLKKHNLDGLADGQAIDSEGNLWVAVYNTHKVIKIDTRKPETLLDVLELPAKQVTSVAFGGPNLDELYVTTANMTIDGVILSKPNNGAVYRVTGIGAKGLPGVPIKL